VSGVWQITVLDGLGARTVQARRAGIDAPFIQSGTEPGVTIPPGWISASDGFALDIADFTGGGTRQGPLVGAILSPWVETSVDGPNNSETLLDAPVAIGVLLHNFLPGPIGRFDHGVSIDVFLPAALSSLTEEDLLAGGNLLALETPQGWEIFQCQSAELIGQDTYRISRFLRGLYGTDNVLGTTVIAGARLIYLGTGWQDLPLGADLRGQDIALGFTTNGRPDSEEISLSYAANHLRPLAPVHIKTKIIGTNLHITWIRRTRQGGDDWASLDVPLGEETERYEVDFLDGTTLFMTKETNVPSLQVPTSDLPTNPVDVAIYQISQNYGRGVGRVYSLIF